MCMCALSHKKAHGSHPDYAHHSPRLEQTWRTSHLQSWLSAARSRQSSMQSRITSSRMFDEWTSLGKDVFWLDGNDTKNLYEYVCVGGRTCEVREKWMFKPRIQNLPFGSATPNWHDSKPIMTSSRIYKHCSHARKERKFWAHDSASRVFHFHSVQALFARLVICRATRRNLHVHRHALRLEVFNNSYHDRREMLPRIDKATCWTTFCKAAHANSHCELVQFSKLTTKYYYRMYKRISSKSCSVELFEYRFCLIGERSKPFLRTDAHSLCCWLKTSINNTYLVCQHLL